jgi:hypothetical protein
MCRVRVHRFFRQQATINIKKTNTTNNSNKYRNSALFLEQKRLSVQKNLRQLQESSISREVIRSNRFDVLTLMCVMTISISIDLKAKSHKNENNRMNRFSGVPVLNDRLRKRRCFADKELDNIPALSTTLDTLVSNSAFRVANLARFRSRDNERNLDIASFSTRTSSTRKWTDFSVAAIIGQS